MHQYPYIPEGRSILYVSADNPFIKMADQERKKSNDHLFPTGAVAVKNEVIIGSAHNRAGYKWNWLIGLHQRGFCPRRWFKIKTGKGYWMCPGCAKPEHHAESSLVRQFVKENRLEELNGADIYLSGHWWCCKHCWDNMIRAGIKNVYLVEGAKEKFETREW